MKRTDALNELLASIRAGLYLQQQRAGGETRRTEPPFVTISRQAGAGGHTVARALADRLNALDPGELPWTVWDRELVEKVAREEHIPVALIESLELEGPRRNAFQDFLASLSAKNDAADLDEFQVFRRVAHTVRALARAGRAIIVGRGGVYATADLAGGAHVRLVAPLRDRVAHMARVLDLSEHAAAAEVRRRDRNRETFHRRYWPDKALLPEIFTITLNTARAGEGAMVESILPLINLSARQPASAAGGGAAVTAVHAAG
jgi:cytidylate kinase